MGFPGQITLNRFGPGGQSAGCFLVTGVNLNLEGEANDGCGKGMAGGSIALYPPKGHKFAPEDCVIVGNTALYGATGGKAFLNGIAGERVITDAGAAQLRSLIEQHVARTGSPKGQRVL